LGGSSSSAGGSASQNMAGQASGGVANGGAGTSDSAGTASGGTRFTVVVDGGAPKTVTTSSQSQLLLASGLSNGAHDLVVWRNTEAAMGVTEFMGLTGFGSGGALLPSAPAPDRRIEVIGDSLSVAAGVEGASTTCNPSIDAFTNNYLAYGSVAARALKADIVTIAWSGIGVYMSYGGTAPTMPARYDYAIPGDHTAWDFSRYQPHVVVLNLGTNDFAKGNPGQPYVDAYVSFVQYVRSKYATAQLVLIDMYGGDRSTAINSVVSTLKKAGVTSVEALSFSSVPNNNTACNSHPNAAAHGAMANILATRLRSLMGW
jgi:lysophospholipase L1-like esterase